jgi:serine/threonine-protein kinase
LRLSIGARVGAYHIVEPIGAGGMGEVYRAHDDRVGRDVALKVLPHRLATDEEARVRFQREAKAIAAISHPNIVALYEFEQEGDLAYVVTELLEGDTLRGLLERGPLPWRRATDIGAAIADGLAAAHARGIVHRDLKPENIFVTRDGVVKLLDFGLAKSRPRAAPANSNNIQTERLDSDEIANESSIIGTLGYMAPEQLRGEPALPATDIFALGCILYEAVTGRNPFIAGSTVETITAVMRDDVAELPRNVPPEYERVVRRCLEKHAEGRFQSARDLAFALRALVTAPVGERVTDTVAPPRSTRMIPAVIAVVAAVIVIAVIIGWRMRDRGDGGRTAIRSLAVLPVTSSADRTADYLSDGITESLIDDLSRLPDLAVVSRTSVFRYKGKDAPPQTIARDLGVQALLTVRVTQASDAVRISTELIDGRTNRHLWGEQYETTLGDLAGAQSTIARQISEQLQPQLSGAAKETVAKHQTASGEAYRLYLQGRYESNKRTSGAFTRAIAFFQQAIAKDPRYALAYAGLADCYTLQSIYYEVAPTAALPLARDAAQRALSIDEGLAEAHTSLAYVRMNFDSDLTAAAREFERAIQLNPNYATARQWYSRCLVTMGRYDEALNESGRAVALDPLSVVMIAEHGGVYSDAGRLDEAAAECRRALDLEPRFGLAHYILAGAYLRMKRYDEAIAEANEAWRDGQDPRSLVRVGICYASAGRLDDARRTLAELEQLGRRRFISSYGVATLMIACGRGDEAFAMLKKASQEMPPGQYQRLLRSDPLLASVRNDARFRTL